MLCRTCGTDFHPTKRRRKGRTFISRYCSKECRLHRPINPDQRRIRQAAQREMLKIPIPCKVCQETFLRKQIGSPICTSIECKKIWVVREKRRRREERTLLCAECKRSFHPYIVKRMRYCSQDCRDNNRRRKDRIKHNRRRYVDFEVSKPLVWCFF